MKSSVSNLCFSAEMSVSSSTKKDAKMITAERLNERRQLSHKHIMLVASLIHISVTFACTVNVIYRTFSASRANECTALSVTPAFIYLLSNAVLAWAFFKLSRNTKNHSRNPDSLRPWIDHSKYLLLKPVLIVIATVSSRTICHRQVAGLVMSIIITTQLFLEIIFVRYYLKWFEREMVSIDESEEANDCKKSWNSFNVNFVVDGKN